MFVHRAALDRDIGPQHRQRRIQPLRAVDDDECGRLTGQGFVPDWSEDNPVILIGHSAGAQTCLQLQQLLAEKLWGVGFNENWVEAVVCVAGVINGSTLTYLSCDEAKGAPGFLV